MDYIMFTKHLRGYSILQIAEGLRRIGMTGVDLCVRPGYPVNPDNCLEELPKAVEIFRESGLSVPLVTAPGDLTDPEDSTARRMYEACGRAGVRFIKIGYWTLEDGDYWRTLCSCRKKLEGFQELSRKTGVVTVVHNHSGGTMGLNMGYAMRLMEGMDPRYVGIFGDVGHLSLVGARLPFELSVGWKYIKLLALKDLIWQKPHGDLKGERKLAVVPFGYGFVEWGTFVRELKARQYDGVLDFHSEYGGYPPEAVLKQAEADLLRFKALWEEV